LPNLPGVDSTQWALALTPIGGAVLLTLILGPFTSASTAQWVAIVWFLVSLPFVIGRLIDRAR
jgi:hypothetical protein